MLGPGHLACLGLAGCTPAPPAPVARFDAQIGDGVALSADATCQGVGRSPVVQWRAPAGGSITGVLWTGEPEQQAVRWAFWDQPSDQGGLAPGIRPGQAPPLQGLNAQGRVGWLAPCPGADGDTLFAELWWTSAPLSPPPTVTVDDLRARATAAAAATAQTSIRLESP